MSAYGRDFLGAVTVAGSEEQELHWTVRPFWHHLQVQTHDDGISVAAVDDLNLPATRRTTVPSVPTVPTVPTLPTQRTRDVEVACPSPPRRPDRTGQAADAVAA